MKLCRKYVLQTTFWEEVWVLVCFLLTIPRTFLCCSSFLFVQLCVLSLFFYSSHLRLDSRESYASYLWHAVGIIIYISGIAYVAPS